MIHRKLILKTSNTKAILLGCIYFSTMFSFVRVFGNVSFITLFTLLFSAIVFFEMIHNGTIRVNTNNKSRIFIAYLIVLAWASYFWSYSGSITIARNYAYTILPLYFYFVEKSDIKDKDIDKVDNLIVFSGFAFFCYALISQGLSGMMSGRFAITEDADQNATCACLFLVLVVTFKQIQKRIKAGRCAVFQIVTFIMTFFLFLLTGSRGGLLALSIWILLISTVRKRGRLFRLVIIGILVISIVYVIAPFVLPTNVYSRLFMSDSYIRTIESSKDRGAIWGYCIEALVPNIKPWGYGAGVPPYLIGPRFGHLYRGIHNTYLNMFLEFGYFGLPIFILLLIHMIRRCVASKRRECLALMIGIAVIAFFLESYPKTYFWNVLTYCSICTINNDTSSV